MHGTWYSDPEKFGSYTGDVELRPFVDLRGLRKLTVESQQLTAPGMRQLETLDGVEDFSLI